MEQYPLHDDENERLESLNQLNILDTPAEERFDRITRLAARSIGVGFSEINLIDEDRQWSKSQYGTSQPESPREHSFCARTMLEDDITVIPDARSDERFSDNPYVKEQPNIRFYMSHKLETPDGFPAGTLCVFDDSPREPSEQDIEMFRDFVDMAQEELENQAFSEVQTELIEELEQAKRKASMDSLTRTWNKGMIMELLERELERAKREELPLSVAMLDLDHFKQVNDEYGHLTGDKVLRTTADRIRRELRPYDAVGRYGGEEFTLIFVESDIQEGREISKRVCRSIGSESIETKHGDLDITASLGVSSRRGRDVTENTQLIEEADELLYEAKDRGRDRVLTSAADDRE
ncbi:MAG: diguanylate cyclase [bacterium]